MSLLQSLPAWTAGGYWQSFSVKVAPALQLALLLDSANFWHTVLLLQFFARMDQLGQKALELRSGVDQAVQNERFEEAAMLQEQIDKLSEEDDVNMVMNVRRQLRGEQH